MGTNKRIKADRFDYYDADPPPLLDFTKETAVARDATKVDTTLAVVMAYERSEWMRLGSFQLMPQDGTRSGVWTFEAFVEDAYDFDHSPVRLLRMWLTGVRFVFQAHGQTFLEGFVHGDPNEFRVPSADYDPRFHQDTRRCKEKECQGHFVVPEGLYIPSPNEALHKIVVGRKVEIRTGRKS